MRIILLALLTLTLAGHATAKEINLECEVSPDWSIKQPIVKQAYITINGSTAVVEWKHFTFKYAVMKSPNRYEMWMENRGVKEQIRINRQTLSYTSLAMSNMTGVDSLSEQGDCKIIKLDNKI